MGTSSSKSKRAKAAKRAQDQVTEVDRQVLGLKTQKRKLNAYAKRVEVRGGPGTRAPRTDHARRRDQKLTQSRPHPKPSTGGHRAETSKARELAKSPATKVKALNALRLRKVQEQLLDRVEGWILQVDELLLGIESAQATAVVLEKLKMGNEALRNAQRGYSLRDVESVLADMDDAREHEEAVRAMIEGSLSAEDDEVCEAELAALEALEAREASETSRARRRRRGSRGRAGRCRRCRTCRRRRRTSRTRDWAPREPGVGSLILCWLEEPSRRRRRRGGPPGARMLELDSSSHRFPHLRFPNAGVQPAGGWT